MTRTDPTSRRTVSLGAGALTIEDVVAVADGRAGLALDPRPEVRARLEASAAMVDRALAEGRSIYGVTTGYGASVAYGVEPDVAGRLSLNLLRYHGCGTGTPFGPAEARAIVAVRAASLARGYSGVTPALLERLCALLDRGLAPVIPAEGSVGASGDLTPLSYVAAVLAGEREVWRDGRVVPAAVALEEAGLPPLVLRPKEALAVMNGTSVMGALGCLGWARAQRLARLACLETAMAVSALEGPAAQFDDRIFELKPHPGQRAAARWIRAGLDGAAPGDPARLQDPYSLRCAPHVVGVLLDALPFTRGLLETEINGVNDNPLLDPEGERVLHGGNFYGGHACLATDTLKNVVANVADLLDRQLALLCNPKSNAGLPANLVARTGPDRFTHHGFKAMEITASALAAEALKMAAPASVFSRSTESHNQDKVSMGTLSARELHRILDLAETVAVVHLLALCQALDLRGPERAGPAARALFDAVRAIVPTNDADRRMDVDVEAALARYRAGELPLGEVDFP